MRTLLSVSALLLCATSCYMMQSTGYSLPGSSVKIKNSDDPLESEVIISSKEYSDFHISLYPDDYFFRAFISKETGQCRIDIYFHMISPAFRYWGEMRYLHDGDIIPLYATVVNSKIVYYPSSPDYIEDVSVSITRSRLQYIARHKSKIRLTSSEYSNVSKDFEIDPTEVNQFFDAIDHVKHQIASQAKELAATPADSL